MTKKKVFWLSLIGTIIYLSLAVFNGELYDYCFSGGHCWRLWDSLDLIGPIIFLFPFIFLFSLITYFLREEVFRAWLKSTYWFVPLYVVLVWWAAGISGGGFGIPSILDQETVAFVLAALYTLISLILIIIKSLLLRGK